MANRLSTVLNSPSWGFWVSLIGSLIGLLGLYAAFHEKQASLRFEITGESNVLDIRQSLPDLQVSFQGEDIQRQNLNLRIITLRITNDGEVDILQPSYDQTEPWGFQLTGGRIIELRPVFSQSQYLTSKI